MNEKSPKRTPRARPSEIENCLGYFWQKGWGLPSVGGKKPPPAHRWCRSVGFRAHARKKEVQKGPAQDSEERPQRRREMDIFGEGGRKRDEEKEKDEHINREKRLTCLVPAGNGVATR
ncbi:uncharacterized protein TM35_000881030 [Trypanosoma theileri]|uniref:Uncharacterized protein n=1 Tax=Trypanosoma theileri TaxID=67003 RepID=A0A1X0NEM7_9TRYP|nr:uncharacterized protein TM35_000881030 [Trypanosoma theileri]ORC82524.1 hypothetical protein TM35_000881030 [Trypanosoma theileri]